MSPVTRAARWVTAGLLDQVVIASANAGNTLLALALLDRARAGTLILSIGLAYLVIGVNRAFVGDVLLALASRYDGERRDRLVRNGLATAVCIGVLAGVVLFGVWAVWRRPGGGAALPDLVVVAPFLPLLLLHDTGRYTYLSDRAPARALGIDLVWVGTQAVCVVALWALHAVSAGGLVAAWGLGATAGATVFLLRSRARPWRGDPRRWVVDTRELSGWFTATALIGQFQVQAVGFLVAGQLGRAAVSGLRGAQTVVLQPVQNFSTAVLGLLVPRASRLAATAATGDAAAAAALRRQTRNVALLFGGLAVAFVAVVWPLAVTVLPHVRKFADVVPLALPISLQAAIYILQAPFTAAMRGMHRARLLFAQYAVFTCTSLTGLVVGAGRGGLAGAAWGLFTGSAVGFVTMTIFYVEAARRLPEPQVAVPSAIRHTSIAEPDHDSCP